MSVCVYISMFMYRIIFVYIYGISINIRFGNLLFSLNNVICVVRFSK